MVEPIATNRFWSAIKQITTLELDKLNWLKHEHIFNNAEIDIIDGENKIVWKWRKKRWMQHDCG